MNPVERKKIKIATDQRKFILVYHDFIESDLLTPHEKLVFIALKKFANSNNQCFPSLKKLSDITKISKRKVQDILKSLEKKHVIKIESRSRSDGGDTSNIYTVYDFEELWISKSCEEIEAVVNEYEDSILIKRIQSKGFKVSKEKELVSVPAKAHPQAQDQSLNHSTPSEIESQVNKEQFSMEIIRKFFDYSAMIHDYPFNKKEIDSTMDIIYDTLNTSKPTVRVLGEDKPTMVVIAKLKKLDKDSIMYAIRKFLQQTNRIKNPKAYLLSILYSAPEQFILDIRNQVSYDEENR